MYHGDHAIVVQIDEHNLSETRVLGRSAPRPAVSAKCPAPCTLLDNMRRRLVMNQLFFVRKRNFFAIAYLEYEGTIAEDDIGRDGRDGH